jgi:hypothetical protein
MDCSESVTLLCRLSGLRDPNGNHYDGEGYTGTLLEYGKSRDAWYSNPDNAGIGAMVVLGITNATPGGKHVCAVRRKGTNPLLFSMGCEIDPAYYSYDVMRQTFAGEGYTFLSIANLGFGKQAS